MHRRSRRPGRIAAAVALAAAGVVLVVALPPASRVVDVTSFPGSAGEPALTVRGAFHVHSRRSDGSGTVDEIAAAPPRQPASTS